MCVLCQTPTLLLMNNVNSHELCQCVCVLSKDVNANSLCIIIHKIVCVCVCVCVCVYVYTLRSVCVLCKIQYV